MGYVELYNHRYRLELEERIYKLSKVIETTNDLHKIVEYEHYLFELKVRYRDELYLEELDNFWKNKKKWLNGCSGCNRIEDYISSNLPTATMKQIRDSYYESLNN